MDGSSTRSIIEVLAERRYQEGRRETKKRTEEERRSEEVEFKILI